MNEKDIFKVAVEFMALFFARARENNSFLNLYLGFVYASKTIPMALEKLNILSSEELKKIDEEISKAASSALDKNLELIKLLKDQKENVSE